MTMNSIENLIDEAKKLLDKHIPSSSSEFKAWRSRCIIVLSNTFGENSAELNEFKHIRYSPMVMTNYTTEKEYNDCYTSGLNESILLLSSLIPDLLEKPNKPNNKDNKTVFIVHGHDEGLKYKIKNLLTTLELDPIILHEKISRSDTIIEKLEYYGSKACAAIILFTPDDFGQAKSEEEKKERARQNVVFEAGFFIGLLGRKNVILVLSDDSIELPGDLKGIVYTKDSSELEISRELKGMGLNVDLNKLF